MALLALLVGIGAGVGLVSLLAGPSTKSASDRLGGPMLVQGTTQPYNFPPWLVIDGKWQTTNGQGSFLPGSSGTSLAVLESSPRVEAAQVRLPSVGNGAGLVFAYQDPADYWALTAVPGYSTWSVVKVSHGAATGEGNLGLDSLADDSVLEVVIRSHTAVLGLDGEVLRVVADPSLIPGRVGLTVTASGARETLFAAFQVVPAPASPEGTQTP
jgi:hypothetical protein